MTDHVLLDNITHQHLRVITARGKAYGDAVSFTNVMPSEIRQLQSNHPLFLRKSTETDQYQVIALFGFEPGENLWLTDDGWQPSYLPLTLERQPFLIGFGPESADGQPPAPVVHIDMDSPRISQSEGEAVFLTHGGNSPYLQRISSVLQAIHDGHAQTRALSKSLRGLGLIEPVHLEVNLNDGSKLTLTDLYTIHEEKIANLTGTALDTFHAQGFLQLAHMMMASLNNMSGLIAKKNATLAK